MEPDSTWSDNCFNEKTILADNKVDVASNQMYDILSRYTRSCLDLRNMDLLSLPIQISLFTKLTVLDLSHNKLREIPSTIEQLTNLKHLDLSHNRFIYLPPGLCRLTQLIHLDISYNPLQTVSANMSRLMNLSLLDLSHTNIQFIPAELLDLSMTTIRTEHCPNLLDAEIESDSIYDLPSLFELCARQIMQPILYQLMTKKKKSRKLKKAIDIIQRQCPPHILEYLSAPRGCSSCGGPYFENHLIRYRLVQRQDESWIPVEYKLCSAHWNTENQRILDMFSFKPRLALPKSKQPCLLELV
ncbi:hypothetical protein G6F46_006762 [Rhizopus delemar]|nr:hypothetical protein G6F48_002298 [Rhizopus delemar]KAG1603036.1 hypothetical protein G6F47_002214 [Rhizopus delemar]KAG1614695.1 hypothetical protein G6F46_006762 [Rhizopus delemar]KAG1639415.1 hypothetical protein G6F44_007854 [Rhizopus delemar]